MVPVEEKLIFNKNYDALHTVNFGRTLGPTEAKIKILESSQRLYDQAKTLQDKLDKKRNFQEMCNELKLLEEVTFKPHINPNSSSIVEKQRRNSSSSVSRNRRECQNISYMCSHDSKTKQQLFKPQITRGPQDDKENSIRQ